MEISLAPVPSPRGPLVFATVIDITARANLAAQLAQAHAELQRHADELEQRGREMSLLAQLGELLESCETLEEAYAVIGGIVEALFTGDAGAVYALAPSRTAAEAVAAWGSPAPVRSVFPPTDCWALRRGRLHVVHSEEPELRCPHVEESIASGLLCAPLSAQTETLGLLHVQVRHRPTAAERAALLAERERLTKTLARQVALALANIRLRETLREQSSRDALTGLYNRRFMEDSLDRELRRAAREGYGLGLLLADLDHFKDLNDAGSEAILRLYPGPCGAAWLPLGGEEFVILLPKASGGHAASGGGAAAAQGHQPHGATMSIGVAAYPEHGTSVDALLLAADSAMYRAKALGRDRVVVAGDAPGRPIEVSAG